MKRIDKENNNTKFDGKVIQFYIKTFVKIINSTLIKELKKFEKHYTNDILEPALADLRQELLDKINPPVVASVNIETEEATSEESAEI